MKCCSSFTQFLVLFFLSTNHLFLISEVHVFKDIPKIKTLSNQRFLAPPLHRFKDNTFLYHSKRTQSVKMNTGLS